METREPSEKVLPNILKTLGFFALFEAIFCLVIALLFKIAPNKMVLPFCLFFLPALLGLPWILSARLFIHKPNLYALLAATGISGCAAFTTIAAHFSGIFSRMFFGGPSEGELISLVIFMAIVAGACGYREARRIANLTSTVRGRE
jgi:hypothetical protein